MFRLFVDTEKESLRKENAQLRKELTRYKQQEILNELIAPYQQKSIGQQLLGAIQQS